jgi:UPF0755 protein
MKSSSTLSFKIIFLIFFLLLSFIFLFDWIKFIHTPAVPPYKSIDYILPPGASVRTAANDLKQRGIIKRPLYFELLAYIRGDARHLHAGEYRFASGARPGDILKQMREGRIVWHQIRFIEGWTFSQMMTALDRAPFITHTFAGLPPLMIMMKMHLPGIQPEGLFFPDTYRYTRGMSDKAILRKAYQTLQKHLNNCWKNRAKNLPYHNSYESLIAASILEKEAHVNSERAQIAGVLVRRLQKNMRLQMDPTVIYAMGDDYKFPLKKENLAIDSLYNTYRYAGLPPTPICMPGLASLQAALHPVDSDALYFVARGDGTHQFSATYQAHTAAIKAYEY